MPLRVPVPPGNHPDAPWEPAPYFVPTGEYGFNPRYAPSADTGPGGDPAGLVGPPDPLVTLRAELDAIEFQALLLRRSGQREWASHRTVMRVNAIIAEVTALRRAADDTRGPHLVSLPTGMLLSLFDLLVAVHPAQAAITSLVAARHARIAARALGET